MNLKTRNTLIVMSLVSVVILTLVGITYRSTDLIIEQTIADHQQAIASETAKSTQLWLDQQMKILNATATSVLPDRLAQSPETMRLLKMAMKAGHFSDVYIGLTDGVLIDGAEWAPPPDYDPRIRPWYRRAIEAGQTAFTTPYIDMVTDELVIALVTPLFHQGRLLGVMGADTILDTLVESLMSVKVGESGFAFIVDNRGTILVHPDQDFVMKRTLVQAEPGLKGAIDRFQQVEAGTLDYFSGEWGRGRREHILAFQNIANTDWFLCTTIPRDEAYALSQKTTLLFAAEMVLKVLGILAFLTLLGVGGSALMLFLFSRRFQSTVQRHQEEMTGISEDLRWNISKRREVELHYQTLFNVANDAILISKGLQYIECNEKATEVFGRDRLQLIGRSMLDLSPRIQADGSVSKSRGQNLLEAAMAGEQQFFEWTFRRADGSEFPSEVSLKTLRLDNEELTLSSIRDVSKRVYAEEQLRQAQKMAAMGEMLGAIAHQWRQPLNTLSTYVASLQSAFYNQMVTRDFVETLVSGADSQIQFMSKTIDDFRHFFRPSKSKVLFDVCEAVASAVKLMEPHFRQGGIDLAVQRPEGGIPLTVHGYQSEFVHVVVNLLANARDAVEARRKKEGREAPCGPVCIEILDNTREIVLRVRDEGCGIPPHLLPRIFTPYFTTKGTASGTGIGLYMAKMIVEREMHGTLTAENRVVGAQFTIRLPRVALKESHA